MKYNKMDFEACKRLLLVLFVCVSVCDKDREWERILCAETKDEWMEWAMWCTFEDCFF